MSLRLLVIMFLFTSTASADVIENLRKKVNEEQQTCTQEGEAHRELCKKASVAPLFKYYCEELSEYCQKVQSVKTGKRLPDSDCHGPNHMERLSWKTQSTPIVTDPDMPDAETQQLVKTATREMARNVKEFCVL